MSMLAGMFGGSAAGGAAGTAGSTAAGSATGTAVGTTAGTTAGGAMGSTVGSAAAGAATSPSMWSQLGSTIGQFGKDYAYGQANPMNTSNLGFNAQTFGQAAKIGEMGDNAGGNMLTAYLQKKQAEEQQRRGY
jgi:hypothetical protein